MRTKVSSYHIIVHISHHHIQNSYTPGAGLGIVIRLHARQGAHFHRDITRLSSLGNEFVSWTALFLPSLFLSLCVMIRIGGVVWYGMLAVKRLSLCFLVSWLQLHFLLGGRSKALRGWRKWEKFQQFALPFSWRYNCGSSVVTMVNSLHCS